MRAAWSLLRLRRPVASPLESPGFVLRRSGRSSRCVSGSSGEKWGVAHPFVAEGMTDTRAVVAVCNLNQWALDFDGNLERVRQSILLAKEKGARFRSGPELEITGYGCEDHFHESDTFYHAQESLAELLSSDVTDDILCDIGMPVMHRNVRYNCRVFCLNRRVLLIRPKMFLADLGNYREGRYFAPWKRTTQLEDHLLSDCVRAVTGQTSVPFGAGMLHTLDATIASETCEELWAPRCPHVDFSTAGAEIIANGSGSHHELRKLTSRAELIQNSMRRCGGVYLYSNQRGCDGSRVYYDGGSLICVNGDLVAQAPQFGVHDVEVEVAHVDLGDVRFYRSSNASFQVQATEKSSVPVVHVPDFHVCMQPHAACNTAAPASSATRKHGSTRLSDPIELHRYADEQECALGPACWLWDYLRRSGASGFFLPLSGGADSSSVAAIVGVMCHMVMDAVQEGNENVIRDVRKVVGADKDDAIAMPETPQELANYIMHTCYMGTENSSAVTKDRAQRLADTVGAFHSGIVIDQIVSAVINVFALSFGGKKPRFLAHGGTHNEDIALQNIQARSRMVMAYLMAQLLPWVRGRSGFLLVLGSANVDEALRGYMTKYDCSSADLNPIGGICKEDLKSMMRWIADAYDMDVLREVATAPPTAELRPLTEEEKKSGEHTQQDEDDMGMSYAELGVFGTLRKVARCGPVSMYHKLCDTWTHLNPFEIAEKVKRFFFYYSVNRHKMTTITPAYHAENYSPDDNRFDLRQFLYNVTWARQFRALDRLVEQDTQEERTTKNATAAAAASARHGSAHLTPGSSRARRPAHGAVELAHEAARAHEDDRKLSAAEQDEQEQEQEQEEQEQEGQVETMSGEVVDVASEAAAAVAQSYAASSSSSSSPSLARRTQNGKKRARMGGSS